MHQNLFTGSQGKSEMTFFVNFPTEIKYSFVEGKNVTGPENPVINNIVMVRDSKGETDKGKVYSLVCNILVGVDDHHD